MGADASTLQSVKSLDETLEVIERRLFNVEDIYLRHENAVVVDNNFVVADKVIRCCCDVNLIVGPLIGRVEGTSVCIGLEIDQTSTVDFHVFSQEQALIGQRHIKSSSHHFQRKIFTVCTIDGLTPNSSYLIYLGGTKKSQILNNILYVNTPNLHSPNHHMCFVNSGRVDSTKPGEPNLWSHLASNLISPAYSRTPKLIIHTGNLIDLQEKLGFKMTLILNYIASEDFSSFRWDSIISDFEEATYDAYRSAFTSEDLKNIFQHCSGYFAAGNGESIVEEFKYHFSTINSMDWVKSVVSMVDTNDNSISSRLKSKAAASKDEQSIMKSVFSSSVNHDSTIHKTSSKAELEELVTLKNMTLSLLARIIRKSYWQYCRQLWDQELVTEAISRSNIFEEKIQNIITIKRRILQLSRINAASITLPESADFAQTLTTELQSLNETLIISATELGEFIIKSPDDVSSSTFQIGRELFVFWETGWSWILPNASLQFPLPLEVEIEQEVMAQLTKRTDLSPDSIDGIVIFGKHIVSVGVDPNGSAYVVSNGLGFNQDLKVSLADTRKLWESVSQWQYGHTSRAAIIIVPNDSSTSFMSGTMHYSNDGLSREQLPMILLGSSTELSSITSKSRISNQISTGMINMIPKSATFPHFRGYASAEFCAKNAPIKNLSTDNGVVEGSPASYKTVSVSLTPAPPGSLLVTVGQVTSQSAIILAQSMTPCVIRMHCTNGSSGVVHELTQYLLPFISMKFEFHNLSPNNNYDISVEGSKVWANFTTLNSIYLPLSDSSSIVESDLRRGGSSNSGSQTSADGSLSKEDITCSLKMIFVGGMGSGDNFHNNSAQAFNSFLIRNCSLPWNGFDVVIHGACTLNWGVALDDVIKLLQRHDVASPDDNEDKWKAEALCLLQNCLRLNFGSLLPTNVSNVGSHYFVSAPQVEFLSSWNVQNMLQAKQELTSLSVERILMLLEEVHDSFHSKLWDGFTNRYCSIRTIADQKLMLLELKPVFVNHNRWLCAEHHALLKQLLQDDMNDTVDTMVVLTPAPVVYCDHLYHQYSALPEESHGYNPHIDDTVRILDFCSQWMMSGLKSRDVIFLSSHNAQSFSTSISFNIAVGEGLSSVLPKTRSDKKSKNTSNLMTLKQYCVGPLTTEHEVVPYPKSGIICGLRDYSYQHEMCSEPFPSCILSMARTGSTRDIQVEFCSGKESEYEKMLESENLLNNTSVKNLLSNIKMQFGRMWKSFDDLDGSDDLCFQILRTVVFLVRFRTEVLEEVVGIAEKISSEQVLLSLKLISILSHVTARMSVVHPGVFKQPSLIAVELFLEWMIESKVCVDSSPDVMIKYIICNGFENFEKIICVLLATQLLMEVTALHKGMND